MLKSLTVENFRSFRKPVQISLELNGHAPTDELSFVSSATGVRASKCLAVIGANASGKTNILHALGFLHWFMVFSFTQSMPDDSIPLVPHFSSTDKPSSFEVEFEYDGKTWRYNLSILKERVLHESLHVRHPDKRRFSYIFVRDWNDGTQSYTVKQDRQRFDFFSKEAIRVRQNASMISSAAQYGVELAIKLVSMNLRYNFSYEGRENVEPHSITRVSQFYAKTKNEKILNWMTSLLTEWDLGLSDIQIETAPTPTLGKAPRQTFVPFGIHRVNGQEHKLMLNHESNGTQSAFILLACLLPVLLDGGLAVIDELEANLHPRMLPVILDLFLSPETNPNNAQIIFTTHSLEILNSLHKSQIVIVEKNEHCESDAWNLNSVTGIRADDNLYAKYMAGAYGGVPRI